MKKEKKTIRTSPTISLLSYEIYKTYGIPISNFLEREAINIVFDEDKLKENVWIEIKLREEKIKFLKEEKIIIDKKISKIEEEIEELKEGVVDSIREKTAKNIKEALRRLMAKVTIQREAFEENEKKGNRYNIKKISMKEVERISTEENITPKMVLPMVHPDVLERYFDKKCLKFVK